MPAPITFQKTLLVAGLLAAMHPAAWAENPAPAASLLPIIVQDTPNPAPWPATVQGSTWVPVFVLGDHDNSILAGPFAADPPAGVLLGVAQIRSSASDGSEGITVAPSLRWRLSEDLRLGASMTVTEFIPCRSLIQSPALPLRPDACESFASSASANQTGLGVSSSLSLGAASFSVGYSESPAIWVLPGAIGGASSGLASGSLRSAAVPLAPLASLAGETAQTLSLSGDLALNDESRVGVALAMSRMPHLVNSPDIGRVQFSVAYGDFSADMATQMIRQGIETLSPWWAGLDLGVSWRTPWAGTISVGARNLVTHGQPPDFGDTPAVNASENDAFSRTPYVRYEQDF